MISSDIIGEINFSVTEAGHVLPLELKQDEEEEFYDEVDGEAQFTPNPDHPMSQISSPPKKVVLNLNVYLTPTFIEHIGGSLEEAKRKAAQAVAVADFFFNWG